MSEKAARNTFIFIVTVFAVLPAAIALYLRAVEGNQREAKPEPEPKPKPEPEPKLVFPKLNAEEQPQSGASSPSIPSDTDSDASTASLASLSDDDE